MPLCTNSNMKSRRRKRSYGNGWRTLPEDMNVIERPSCKLRYQQTTVDVYAHFMASDHDSGRVTYLINRRTWLRVTDLVLPLLRVSDPRIANLRERILQGRGMGRTEVQVSTRESNILLCSLEMLCKWERFHLRIYYTELSDYHNILQYKVACLKIKELDDRTWIVLLKL